MQNVVHKMNLRFLLIMLIAFGVGAGIGFFVSKTVRSQASQMVVWWIARILMIITCVIFLGGLAYWHLSVEPRLDGTEGAGVGFGWVAVHIGGAVLALFGTGIAVGSGIKRPSSPT